MHEHLGLLSRTCARCTFLSFRTEEDPAFGHERVNASCEGRNAQGGPEKLAVPILGPQQVQEMR
jgi:hypothetical protein